MFVFRRPTQVTPKRPTPGTKQKVKSLIVKCYSTCKTKSKELKIGIIGIPFRHGQPKDGVQTGPDHIRKAGLIEALKDIPGVKDVKDYGDLCEKMPQKDLSVEERQKHVIQCNKTLSEKVCEVLGEGRMVINLGGDHSIATGSIYGHHLAKQDKGVAVVWIDAHADINTYKSSDTGNMHGMPMSHLLIELSKDKELFPGVLPGMEWCKPCISSKRLGYMGLRSVDHYERLFIDKYHIAAYDMYRMDRLGALSSVHELLYQIDPYHKHSIHVSFDIDALDPLEAPTTGTPVRCGMTLREAVLVMEELHKTGRLNVMDLVEVNPALGDEKEAKITSMAALQLIETGCGANRRGTWPLKKKEDEK